MSFRLQRHMEFSSTPISDDLQPYVSHAACLWLVGLYCHQLHSGIWLWHWQVDCVIGLNWAHISNWWGSPCHLWSSKTRQSHCLTKSMTLALLLTVDWRWKRMLQSCPELLLPTPTTVKYPAEAPAHPTTALSSTQQLIFLAIPVSVRLCEMICSFHESEQPSLADGAFLSLLQLFGTHFHHISALHP